MKIEWMPVHHYGLTWKLFDVDASPGNIYKGRVHKAEPRHYIAVTKHGSMLSSLTMREAAEWLEKVSCLAPRSN